MKRPATTPPSKGQSTVEFVLVAPLLFLFFFTLVQGAILAWTCLSVQRAAQAVVRHAVRVEREPQGWDSPRLQALVALAPLCRLHKAYLVSSLLAEIHLKHEGNDMVATVRFPMPLWIPLAAPLLGEKLVIPTGGFGPESTKLVQKVSQILGTRFPDLPSSSAHLPFFCWVTFQAIGPMEPPPLKESQ